MSRIHIRKHILEINWLKLHRFVEFSLHLLIVLKVLLDIRVDLVQLFLLVLIIRLVNRVSLPTALLLVPKIVLVIDLFVLALYTYAKLTAFLPFLEAQTIFLLAMRFFAGTKNQILHARLVCIDLFEIMHIFAIFLLDKIQNLILFILSLLVFLIFLQLKASCLLQILIFECNAFGAALSNNTYLSWTQITYAMILLTFLYGASALMLDAIIRISIEVLFLDVYFDLMNVWVHEQGSFDLLDDLRKSENLLLVLSCMRSSLS